MIIYSGFFVLFVLQLRKAMGTIKDWAEDDKPREKFIQKGSGHVSNAELLAILIRSGSLKEDAISISRKILSYVKDDLNSLAKLKISDLCKFEGIGEVKALSILAALELGGRREASETRQRAQISSSKDAFIYLKWRLEDLPHEEFWILTLNRNNKIIGEYKVSEGGVSGTFVDSKRVFTHALNDNASSVILFHNHPSGNLSPSNADKELTKKLVQGAKYLDMQIIDHIIVAGKNYYSFMDEGDIQSL